MPRIGSNCLDHKVNCCYKTGIVLKPTQEFLEFTSRMSPIVLEAGICPNVSGNSPDLLFMLIRNRDKHVMIVLDDVLCA